MLLPGFSVLSKHTSPCVQEELGIGHTSVMGFMGDCPTVTTEPPPPLTEDLRNKKVLFLQTDYEEIVHWKQSNT